MTEKILPCKGRFVWYDLLTTELEKSKKYYAELFGWTVKAESIGSPDGYNLIRNREAGIGGMIQIEPAREVPAHWSPYVAVDDIQASVALAQELGGKIHVEATAIPTVGQYAVVFDPQGAAISFFQSASAEPMPEDPEVPTPGTFCWNELLTTDPEGALKFYQPLFDWGLEKMEMGPAGTYHIFKRGAKQEAGMMLKPPGAEGPPMWLSYVAVADVDRAAAKVQELGGMLFVPPRDIPSVGRFSVTADSMGAGIALFKGLKG